MPRSPRSILHFGLWAVALLFVGSILWSMWAETLLPLLRAGDVRGVVMHALGIPIILVGTGVFVWGGARFVRDTFHAMQDPALQAGIVAIREGTRDTARSARHRNLRVLLGAWKHGSRLLLIGFALIALGGYLINH